MSAAALEAFAPVADRGVGFDDLAGRLAQSRQSIEQSFLDMGERLMECARLLREITSAHEGMPGELHGAEFSDAVGRIHALREEAGRINASNGADAAQVEQLAVIARQLHGPIDRLNNTVRNVRLIAVNARIVAAGMYGQGGDFDAFALEMVDLGKDASRIVGEFSDSHARLVETLEIARTANRHFLEKHGGTLTAVATRLGAQLAALDEHKRRAAADAAESGRLAAQISAGIGAAVSALQIGDITRQRLEHVEDGLNDLDRTSADMATRATVRRLQYLQLEDAGSDFTREVSSFSHALQNLAGDATRVFDHSRVQSGALLTQGGTALAGLVKDLEAMSILTRDFDSMRSRLADVQKEVNACVGAMQERMELVGGLEQSMRLLSINTAVRCSRLGDEGRALRVIAQEMRELAAHTVESAGNVTTLLDETRSALGAPDAAAGGDALTRPGSLADDTAFAIGRLNAVIERLRQLAATIAELGPRTAKLLEVTASGAKVYEGFADNWAQVLDHLGDAGADEEDEAEPDPEFLARLRSRYTMASERRIHDAVCGEPDYSAPPPSLPEEAAAVLF